MKNKLMLCGRCKKNESTGIIFNLCDLCFEAFEKECEAKGVHTPSDETLALINEPWIKRDN